MRNILFTSDKFNVDKARTPAAELDINHFFPIVIVTENFMLTNFRSWL